MRGSMVLHPGVCVNRAAVVDTRDGSLQTGVTNALWQKAFTPEWGATRRQAGGKVKRCATAFDALIPWNDIIYIYTYILPHWIDALHWDRNLYN